MEKVMKITHRRASHLLKVEEVSVLKFCLDRVWTGRVNFVFARTISEQRKSIVDELQSFISNII